MPIKEPCYGCGEDCELEGWGFFIGKANKLLSLCEDCLESLVIQLNDLQENK